MKVATLTLIGKDGKVYSFADVSLVPLIEMAKKVRAEGVVEVGKKLIQIASGLLQASWKPAPVMQFKC